MASRSVIRLTASSLSTVSSNVFCDRTGPSTVDRSTPAPAPAPDAGADAAPPARESRPAGPGHPMLGLDIGRSLSINGLILNHSLHRWQISVRSAPGLSGLRPP